MSVFWNTYLHTDNTAPATAVLTFIHCLTAAAQGIKSQDSSHTVSNEAHLEKWETRGRLNKMMYFFDMSIQLETEEWIQCNWRLTLKPHELTWPEKAAPSRDFMKSVYTWLARTMTVDMASWYCREEVARRGRAARGMWSWILDRQPSS